MNYFEGIAEDLEQQHQATLDRNARLERERAEVRAARDVILRNTARGAVLIGRVENVIHRVGRGSKGPAGTTYYKGTSVDMMNRVSGEIHIGDEDRALSVVAEVDYVTRYVEHRRLFRSERIPAFGNTIRARLGFTSLISGEHLQVMVPGQIYPEDRLPSAVPDFLADAHVERFDGLLAELEQAVGIETVSTAGAGQ